jgi:hypothetical protein
MKPILLVGLCSWLIIGCSPTRPSSEPPLRYEPALIKVETLKTTYIEQMVKQILKSANVNDWDITQDDSYIYIEARYAKLSPAKAAEIKDRLQELPWVVNIDIRYDGIPVKNIR